mgnify:CR=1 FL=1
MNAPAVLRKLPGSLNANRRLDQWLRFNSDRTVTVLSGKVEIGQGVITAMAQVAAEELDLPLERLRMVNGDTGVAPDEGQTSGSRSANDGGLALRYACAEARQLLLNDAAGRLGCTPDTLHVMDGRLHSAAGATALTYWDLPHATLLDREASAGAAPKDPAQHVLVGKAVARLDIPDKVTGRPRFVHDMELPGMLFGRVVRAPHWEAQLVSFDAEAIRKLPGVVAVVVDGNYIGVVAAREEQAVKARLAAIAAASWREPPEATDEAGLYDYFQSRNTRDQVIFDRKDAPQSRAGTRQIAARYTKPYLAHAALGPSCAVAQIDAGGSIEIWSHTQGVYPLRDELALVLGVAPGRIVVHHAEGAGCFGHNGADDVALDAVLLSRATGGRPVKVQWMRDDEFGWEPSGSAMLMELRGALDDSGHVTDWQYAVWGNGYRHRPGSGKPGTFETSLSGAWLLAKPVPRAPQYDQVMVGDKGGGGGLAMNAVAPYDFPNHHAVSHLVAERPIRVSSLRSLGGYGNIFAVESFMDEMAIAAGADPVAFRLRSLKDPRARAVVELAAQKAGWTPGDSDGVTGRGIAFAQVSNQYSYVAVVVELGIDPDIRVKRVVAAVDVGQVLNSDGVINQIEGGIVQAVSWSLKEQVHFDAHGVTGRDWEQYPILTFPEVPVVEVHLIDRPHEVPVGAGESVMGHVAAAIANALEHIAGVRIRDLPITREKIAAAA